MAGRKPSTNTNLPKGMRARKRGKNIYYYYDVGGKPRKEIPLGKDYILAIQQWSKLEMDKLPKDSLPTFVMAAMRYEKEVIPTKAKTTQKSNLFSLSKLYEFFGGETPAPLDEIHPSHIKQYYNWRKSAPISANREVALFNHIWTMCSEAQWEYTNKPSPAKGVNKFKEEPRDVYIEDYIFDILYNLADQDVRDAMDIAYLLGQRPADTLKIKINHIQDGILSITQNKTKAKLRFAITGKLKEIITRRMSVGSVHLFSTSIGTQLTTSALNQRFAKIRKKAIDQNPELKDELSECQFRDLRAKSGTDAFLKSDSIEIAQRQLGHTSSDMTKRYIRKDKVLKPLG